tara:strand:+ start:241 stop:945 length:705 start_codon:yes stop_codon:yes gene_type:complete
MDKDYNFETYLVINPHYFLITVINKKNKNKIYEKKEIIQNNLDQLNLILFDKFLKTNVFEIEKKIKNFLNDIFLILDYKIFFPVQISIKKNLSGKLITTEKLNYLLNEIKKDCFKTFLGKKIIHIILDRYLVDDKSYSNLPTDVNCNYLSLDISFFCLSNKDIKSFEEILKKYHILINRILSADYVRSLFDQNNHDLISIAKLVKDGYNKNEVEILEKKRQNIGLFERFFHLFR